MNTFPVLETERLYLRQGAVADVLPLLRAMQDPDVLRYYGMEPYRTEQEAIAEIGWFTRLFEQDEGIRWVIAEQTNSAYIGDIGFFKLERAHARAEIGYKLCPPFWGKGYMTEALRAALAHGFTELGLNRVEALVDPRNPASMRVLNKVGFRAEGLLREYEIERGQPVDLVMLSLLGREWATGPL